MRNIRMRTRTGVGEHIVNYIGELSTGVVDKYGNEIFENDILVLDGVRMIVVWDTYNVQFKKVSVDGENKLDQSSSLSKSQLWEVEWSE